jgi:hypothetical protein
MDREFSAARFGEKLFQFDGLVEGKLRGGLVSIEGEFQSFGAEFADLGFSVGDTHLRIAFPKIPPVGTQRMICAPRLMNRPRIGSDTLATIRGGAGSGVPAVRRADSRAMAALLARKKRTRSIGAAMFSNVTLTM